MREENKPKEKGKHGGSRPNTGGARAGAGRPKKPKKPIIANELPDSIANNISNEILLRYADPKDFLIDLMNGKFSCDEKMQVDAAKTLMPYFHKRLGEGGKKEEAQENAGKVASGKFGPSAPPKLAVVKK